MEWNLLFLVWIEQPLRQTTVHHPGTLKPDILYVRQLSVCKGLQWLSSRGKRGASFLKVCDLYCLNKTNQSFTRKLNSIHSNFLKSLKKTKKKRKEKNQSAASWVFARRWPLVSEALCNRRGKTEMDMCHRHHNCNTLNADTGEKETKKTLWDRLSNKPKKKSNLNQEIGINTILKKLY